MCPLIILLQAKHFLHTLSPAKNSFSMTSFQHSPLIHTTTFHPTFFRHHGQIKVDAIITIHTQHRTLHPTLISNSKIEAEFQMVDDYISCCPTCINLIAKSDKVKTALAVANLTYGARTNKKNLFYDVQHRSVLFLSQTPLLTKMKRDTFNCNSILLWSFAEAATITSLQKDNVHHSHNYFMFETLSTSSARGKGIRSALHD